ncbi:MAG: response regulator transcription factor [Deferribacteraceae bacterium]|nr:response regulator transcription factor [Deferribacteraceae bacterium]
MALTILIIDDDDEICELVRLFLELEGYSVIAANSGVEGLDLFRSKSPDLVILDIGLPDVNGQQLCRIIRAESRVPIIMLSAKDSVSDKVLCLDYGADDYITKPFENIELLARINALKRRSEQKAQPIAINGKNNAFHHLTIDDTNRQVFYNGEQVLLTPKEYELLIYFSKNSGQSLQRDQIISDLWGNDALYKWSRSLDVHVQNLRQKIEINPKNPEIIKTVSGVGYKIK